MFKRALVLFIIVASMGAFEFAFLGKDLIKVIELSGIAMVALIIMLQLVYSRGDKFKMHFSREIAVILLGVFLSMFTAYTGHYQGFSTTIIAQRFMYFYLLYLALHFIRISDIDLEKIIIYIGITFALFYLLQYLAYPTRIFDVRMAVERGTVRIFLQGLSYVILAYFLILNKLFERFSLSRLALLFGFLSIFILMGTRQILLAMFLLTVMNVLFSKRVRSKMLILVLIGISLIPTVLIFQDIFLGIISVSQEQSQTTVVEEDIRVQAATFFLTELFPNRIAYITGNGAPSANSPYGQMIQMYMDVFRFYQSDVGIIGDYSKFGIFFVIGVVILMVRILTAKLSNDYIYIKYFYYTTLLTLFTGGGGFAEGGGIVVICITLYIIDIDKHNRQLLDAEDDPPDDDEELISTTELIKLEQAYE